MNTITQKRTEALKYTIQVWSSQREVERANRLKGWEERCEELTERITSLIFELTKLGDDWLL